MVIFRNFVSLAADRDTRLPSLHGESGQNPDDNTQVGCDVGPRRRRDRRRGHFDWSDTGHVPHRLVPVMIDVPSAALGAIAGLNFASVMAPANINVLVGPKGRALLGGILGDAIGQVFMIFPPLHHHRSLGRLAGFCSVYLLRDQGQVLKRTRRDRRFLRYEPETTDLGSNAVTFHLN